MHGEKTQMFFNLLYLFCTSFTQPNNAKKYYLLAIYGTFLRTMSLQMKIYICRHVDNERRQKLRYHDNRYYGDL